MTAAQLVAAPHGETDQVLPLPHAARVMPAVRRHVRRVLSGWGLPADAAEDVLLVVSELVTNALVHARPPATLRLRRVPDGACRAVRVEVTDQGPAAPPEPCAAPDPDEHGRGLGIVAALSARCGVRAYAGEVNRWAEVPVG
ncbi:ATP-binding protein [Streptomyces thermoalcalitolerans]|uniref:Histidine kinase/HSP90-like ATPase domain-containing protein n=1 Tax=Streptomyces thermoalcalitolerans TaxID=65605 RepID=A0ABN1NJH1_9ACTN